MKYRKEEEKNSEKRSDLGRGREGTMEEMRLGMDRGERGRE